MNSALIELLNCCRFCLRQIETEDSGVSIDDHTKNSFFEITGMELIDDPENYSSLVCENCYQKMCEHIQFRNDLMESQKNLYECKEEYVEVLYDGSNNEVLEIVNDYDSEMIECVVEESENEQGVVKNEVYEVSFYDKSVTNQALPKKERKKTCFICGLGFAISGFYHHMKRAHNVGKQFECDFCGKCFNLKGDLMMHLKKHQSKENRTKLPCDLCGSLLLSKSSLNNHIKTFHSNVVEIHPCEYCDRSFKSRIKLLQHMKVAHDDGRFYCAICDKYYSTKQYLQKHIKQCHSIKKLVDCLICGKAFPEGTQMRRHMNTHEDKKFICDFENCGKVFAFRASLNKHIEAVHQSSTNAVSCEQCGFSFPTLRHLTRHISRQHNQVKVQCEVVGCNQLFGRKDYLASHYKTHKDIDEVTKLNLLERVKNIKAISW